MELLNPTVCQVSYRGDSGVGPGRARSFTAASSHYMAYPISTATSLPISMVAWVKTSNNGNAIVVCGLYNSGSTDDDYLEISKTTGNVARGVLKNTSSILIDVDSTIHDNAYHSIAFVVEAAQVSIYLDGSPDAENPKAHSVSLPTFDYFAIGVRYDASPARYWDGAIDEVSLWLGTALSAANVATIDGIGTDSTKSYLTELTAESLTPTHHWKMTDYTAWSTAMAQSAINLDLAFVPVFP